MHDLIEPVYAAIGKVAVAAANLEWRLAVCSIWLRDGEMIDGVTLAAALEVARKTGAPLKTFQRQAAGCPVLEQVAAHAKALLEERSALVHGLAWRPLAPDGHDHEPIKLFRLRSEPMEGKVPDEIDIEDLAARIAAMANDIYLQTKAAIESHVPQMCPAEDA